MGSDLTKHPPVHRYAPAKVQKCTKSAHIAKCTCVPCCTQTTPTRPMCVVECQLVLPAQVGRSYWAASRTTQNGKNGDICPFLLLPTTIHVSCSSHIPPHVASPPYCPYARPKCHLSSPARKLQKPYPPTSPRGGTNCCPSSHRPVGGEISVGAGGGGGRSSRFP